MRKKYSPQFKQKIVKEYLDGNISYVKLAKKHNIPSASRIFEWVRYYQRFGESGLNLSSNSSEYSVDFKIRAIMMYESSERSYHEVALELGIKCPDNIRHWRKAYKDKGIKGLSTRLGRLSMSKNKDKSIDKKTQERIEELERENLLLQIKIEYLEQLRSLGKKKQTEKKQ